MSSLTVIMATRNSARFVAHALASITSQRYASLEIVVVDADSTDGTQEIVCKAPHTRLERQRGAGLWQAWNQAIEQVTTPFIAMIDSDDLWEQDSLAVHMAAFDQCPDAVASIGLTRFFCEDVTVLGGIRPNLLVSSHRGMVPGATMFRREVFDMLGHFREELSTMSDVEWFLRLRQSNLHIVEPDAVVLAKRVHSGNLSRVFAKQSRYDRDLIQIARESIQRRASATQAGTL